MCASYYSYVDVVRVITHKLFNKMGMYLTLIKVKQLPTQKFGIYEKTGKTSVVVSSALQANFGWTTNAWEISNIFCYL